MKSSTRVYSSEANLEPRTSSSSFYLIKSSEHSHQNEFRSLKLENEFGGLKGTKIGALIEQS